MTVRMASMSSDVVFEQVRDAQEMANAIVRRESGVTPTVTGSARLFAQLDGYLVDSQITSFATAFVTVFAVIFVVFRSFRLRVAGHRAEHVSGDRGARARWDGSTSR